MIIRDQTPSKVIDTIGTKHVKIKTSGKEKLGYTLGISVSMSGKMLQTLVIWPTKGKKKFKTLIPSNLYVEYREEGSWMDKKVLKNYARGVWRPFFRSMPSGLKGLILLDNHESHLSTEILEPIKELGVELMYFPPNCTSLIQPLAIGINKIVKDNYRLKWEIFNCEAKENQNMVVVKNPRAVDLENISNETFLKWISDSLSAVSVETIQNSFKILTDANKLNEAFVAFQDNEEEKLENETLESLLKELTEKNEADDDNEIEQDNEYPFIQEMLDYEICDSINISL
jgi:hypothetical protein